MERFKGNILQVTGPLLSLCKGVKDVRNTPSDDVVEINFLNVTERSKKC